MNADDAKAMAKLRGEEILVCSYCGRECVKVTRYEDGKLKRMVCDRCLIRGYDILLKEKAKKRGPGRPRKSEKDKVSGNDVKGSGEMGCGDGETAQGSEENEA